MWKNSSDKLRSFFQEVPWTDDHTGVFCQETENHFSMSYLRLLEDNFKFCFFLLRDNVFLDVLSVGINQYI